MSIIKLQGVSKFYYNKNTVASGFNKINLELNMGEFVVITGESGSGKSTLLNVISGLDSYEEGEMYINGEETSHYTEVDYELYRRKYIGNIFQNFNLVNSYTVYQNVELALIFNGHTRKEVKKKVLDIIKTVGLSKYKNTKASKLSGGQKQRVAIARALAKDTPIIVADEPTGNLDVKSAQAIMKLLHDISKYKLIVIVTHNYEQVSEYATRKITMHDGKIIEDKELQDVKVTEPKEVDFRNITLLNRLNLGFRNAFNIKIKFILLLLVYFFLTSIVFMVYTNLQKMNYDEADIGMNYYFSDLSPNRVIINKKDRTSFTTQELVNLKKLANVEKVVENDIFLDMYIDLYSDNIYFSGVMADINEIDKVDMGRLPQNENEIVIKGQEWNYHFSDENLFKNEFKMNNSNVGAYDDNLKVCGVIFDDSNELTGYEENTFYVSSNIVKNMSKGANIRYSSLEISVNDHIFKNDFNSTFYYEIRPLAKLKSGEAYVLQELNGYCPYYNCVNRNMNIKVENIYYTDEVYVRIKNYTTKNNFRYLTGLKSYEENAQVIYISEEDYNKLFVKDTYQVGLFLKDTKVSSDTISKLDNLGYDTIYMRDILVNELGQAAGILKLLRGILYLIAVIVLFFISYFVIKIILKSRNVYFSTIRILGATKKQANQLLNIELLIDVNVAYFIFIGAILFVKSGLVHIEYIQDVITYFKKWDYVIVYATLILMSFLISNRYAHKLFVNSAMSTYREEA